MSGDKSAESNENKGKPSGSGREGSGLRDVNKPDREKKIAREYLDENEQPAANVNVRNENRNTDKGRDQQGKDTSSV